MIFFTGHCNRISISNFELGHLGLYIHFFVLCDTNVGIEVPRNKSVSVPHWDLYLINLLDHAIWSDTCNLYLCYAITGSGSVVLTIRVIVMSSQDRGFVPRSGQIKDCEIDIICFFPRHAALMSSDTYGCFNEPVVWQSYAVNLSNLEKSLKIPKG